MTATQDDSSSRLGAEAVSLGSLAAAMPGTLKFATGDRFLPELRRRVDQYLKLSGRRPRDCPTMYLKTALIFGCLGVSYVGLLFLAASWWTALPLAIVLGLSMAAVGFNVQHDGGHQAYSDRGWINKLMAMSLDLLGGSSYVWAKKHNSVHHSYTNVTGHDDDINIGFFGRLSPHQPRLGFHRLQHFYLWLLYGLLPIKWQLYDDFRDVLLGRIGGHRMPRPKGWDLVVFIAGKATFFSLAFVVPLMLHAAWPVLLFYVVASFAQGVMLSTVFQMAHCVESAAFPLPRPDDGRINDAWAVHQVETTVDFARGNWLLSWIIGGLNSRSSTTSSLASVTCTIRPWRPSWRRRVENSGSAMSRMPPCWQASPLISAGCGRWAPADAKIAAHLEEPAVYCKLDLEFIEPQLREGSGEIEAAVKGQLPRLVLQDDLRGDLHVHSTASDDANSLAEMAAAGKERGYEYIGITDQSQLLKITNGLSESGHGDLSEQGGLTRLWRIERPPGRARGILGCESHADRSDRGFFCLIIMDEIEFQAKSLTQLLGNLPPQERLQKLHKSLQWLLDGGLDPSSVRTIELRVCEQLGLPITDPLERLPHIFVNCVQQGTQGVKLGFMSRSGSEELVKAQAETIRKRLEQRGCEVSETVYAPNPNEQFFWFRARERAGLPTIRELLESYDDVILR